MGVDIDLKCGGDIEGNDQDLGNIDFATALGQIDPNQS